MLNLFAENINNANSVAEWFSQFWEGIKSFFITGQMTQNSVTTSFLGKLLIALVIFIPLYIIIRLTLKIVSHSWSKSKNVASLTYKGFVLSSTKVILYFILLVIALSILGLNLSGLSTVISSGVVAIGLSLQSVISNFASGIILLSSKKFIKGDYISLNNGTIEGTVMDIKVLETQVLTTENVLVSIPNSNLFTGIVANYNVMKYRRIDLTISVGYGQDVDKIKKILIYCAKTQKGANLNMAISCFVKNLSASNVDFALRLYAPTSIFWDVKWELGERIYKELVKRNVDISYDQVVINQASTKAKTIKVDDIENKDLDVTKNPENPAVYRENGDSIDKIINDFTNKNKSKKNKSNK